MKSLPDLISPQRTRIFQQVERWSLRRFIPILFCMGAMLADDVARAEELTPELIADLKMVKEVRMAPEGDLVSYILTGGKATQLWVANVEGDPHQRQMLIGNNRVSLARWSSDGRLAVVAQSESKPHRSQLLLVDPISGESRVLADNFIGSSLEWSPDGKSLGYLLADRGGTEEKQTAGGPQVHRPGSGRSGVPSRFFSIDANTGITRALTPATHSLSDYAWAPRGDAIVALARSSLAEGRSSSVTIFPLVGGGQPRSLFAPEDQTIGLAWSPDGSTIAWCGRELTPGSGQLVLIDATGETAPRTVQADFPGSLHNIVYRADGRLAFGALENLRAGIYSVAGDGTDLRADHAASSFAPGSLGVGSFTRFSVSFSADGEWVASMVSGPNEPANVIAGRWRGELTRRTALNPVVEGLKLGTVEEISWRSFDGLEIHGFLVKPAGFDAQKKYPMIVEAHGGPRRSWWATCFLNSSHWAQWLASRGYVVLMPNPRGSEGRGAVFVRANRKDLGGGDWRDVVAGMNHVLDMGFVDHDRLALAGWSYGGYLTAWGITQPEGRVFKAAVIGAGITNLFTRGGAAGGWSDNHWGDPQALWRYSPEFFNRSPIAHVGNVQAATLILHGDRDGKVPHSQAMEFYTALKTLDVPVEARIYPGEGHSIGGREHRIDLLNSIARWFNAYLPPEAQ